MKKRRRPREEAAARLAREEAAARLARVVAALEPIPARPRFRLLGLSCLSLAFLLPATCSTALALSLHAGLPAIPGPRAARVAPAAPAAPAPVASSPSPASPVDVIVP